MTNLEAMERAMVLRFWTNAITLGLVRLAIIAACVKYIFWS